MVEPIIAPFRATAKYNPHLWGDEELRAIFVARARELAEIVEKIRGTRPDAVPQHLLVTGQRGMGKTTLLRRIALAVADDAELSRQWIALTFPEEQYTVSNPAELWSNVLDALADTLEREGVPASELARLDAEFGRIAELPPREREESALALLDGWVKQHGRRILLLIDSTDLLFSGLSAADAGAGRGKRGGAAGATPLWRLRKTLSHDRSIFWLGASYQALESSHQYSDAFHDFFEILELRPLTVAEMREAMIALARTFGAGGEGPGDAAAAAMARTLDARPERLKTLRAITGGNPRTTVILYDLFAAGWQDDLHTDLKVLLDAMSPLYKSRMEMLAEQPRKLLAHLMEHWAPMAVKDLAEVSGIPNTTVSGQLTRLEAEGLVEKARLAGTRRAGWQVAERFFNIWYLMRYTSRRVRQRLTWLVEFMRLWYSGEEKRAGELAGSEEGIEQIGLVLQAQSWLSNRKVAQKDLERLAQAASEGDTEALFRLREQARECHAIGLGPALSDLMAGSAYADFLRPMELALRAAAGDAEALDGTAPEIRAMAEEVLAEILRPAANPMPAPA
jgi:DNA-binding transcriptional regulator GbsR (MarR family)